MAIRYLDGSRLRRSAAAAARWVGQRQENLNGINVFPVPDGDTGTNLAATLVSAVERAQRVRARGLGAVSRALADGALFGACGNSGAILAQFFEGFAGAVEGRERARGERLAIAVASASAAAERALSQPREGTILTVMRVWADRFARASSSEGADLIAAFQEALAAAREALAATPGQLRELARAGVVDAGAQGFVYFLEGILHFAEGRIAGAVIEEGDHAAPIERAAIAEDPGSIAFRFCTECLIEGEGLEVAEIRRVIEPLGDSIVVAGSPSRVRVHVHTDDPEAVFAAASARGCIARTKADDMRDQHTARFDREGVAVVTDTAADLPERDVQRLKIHTVPLRVLLGSAVYLDKQTLRPDEVYERLRRGERTVRTSQPAPGDYAALYRYLFEHYGSIVVVSLSGKLSGTANAARRAAELVGGQRVTIVDTGTASIAQGLIVRAAAERRAAGGTVAQIVATAEDARARVRFFFAVPTLAYLERGGRVGGWQVKLASWLHVVPILKVQPDKGRPRLAGLARRGRAHVTALAKAGRAIAGEARSPDRIWIAHAGAPEVGDAFRSTLAAAVPDAEIEVLEVGPVLGAHAGPGAVAVAWLGSTAPEPTEGRAA
ncbi:DegV family protein [soil metagenome]